MYFMFLDLRFFFNCLSSVKTSNLNFLHLQFASFQQLNPLYPTQTLNKDFFQSLLNLFLSSAFTGLELSNHMISGRSYDLAFTFPIHTVYVFSFHFSPRTVAISSVLHSVKHNCCHDTSGSKLNHLKPKVKHCIVRTVVPPHTIR